MTISTGQPSRRIGSPPLRAGRGSGRRPPGGGRRRWTETTCPTLRPRTRPSWPRGRRWATPDSRPRPTRATPRPPTVTSSRRLALGLRRGLGVVTETLELCVLSVPTSPTQDSFPVELVSPTVDVGVDTLSTLTTFVLALWEPGPVARRRSAPPPCTPACRACWRPTGTPRSPTSRPARTGLLRAPASRSPTGAARRPRRTRGFPTATAATPSPSACDAPLRQWRYPSGPRRLPGNAESGASIHSRAPGRRLRGHLVWRGQEPGEPSHLRLLPPVTVGRRGHVGVGVAQLDPPARREGAHVLPDAVGPKHRHGHVGGDVSQPEVQP